MRQRDARERILLSRAAVCLLDGYGGGQGQVAAAVADEDGPGAGGFDPFAGIGRPEFEAVGGDGDGDGPGFAGFEMDAVEGYEGVDGEVAWELRFGAAEVDLRDFVAGDGAGVGDGEGGG